MNKILLFTALIYTVAMGNYSCKTDPIVCDGYKEIKRSKTHLVDPKLLNEAPFLTDILEKNPQMQLSRVINDEFMIGMHCNQFYKNLFIINGGYGAYVSKRDGFTHTENNIIKSVNISVEPKLNYNTAIDIAKQNMNFNESCICYELAIYSTGVDYKLVWLVKDLNNSYPYVIVDAHSGEVIEKNDGKIICF
ncbi:MAG: PepSY domain-containing protein [Bacteroidia bacterium]